LVLLDQVREQSLDSVLSEILDIEAHLRRIALMRFVKMTLQHSLGQKADQSRFAAGNRACQRVIMRVLMPVSGATLFEAVLPKFTLGKPAFEWSWSIILEYIGTFLMASGFAGNEPARWRITEGVV
jgi:hypothetical protein